MSEMLDSVRRFVAGEIAPHAAEVDRSGELAADLWRKLGEQGLAGLAVPTRWGGVAADLGLFVGCFEVLGGACASTAWVLLAHSLAARAIALFGADAQKERLLPELAAGRRIGAALAVTEAGGGSNPLGMHSRARREGDAWVLEGSKEFITLAGLADVFVVMARTGEPPPALGCFLVQRDDAGFSSGRREELLGLRGVPVGGLAFNGCRLPGDRLLGPADGGLAVMGAVGGWGLAGAAAAALGIAQAALDNATAHAKERVVAGAALASLPGVQAVLGDLRIELAGARARLARALEEIKDLQGPPLPLFMAKVAVTECAVRVVDRCMGLYGVAGYTRALPAERRLRDVRAFTIHWANNDVLRDTLRKGAVA